MVVLRSVKMLRLMAWQSKIWRPKREKTYPGGPIVLGNSEKRVALQLHENGVPFEYEKFKVKYTVNKERTYTTDFKLENGIIIEVKGWFTSDDRVKALLIKEQHPELDIRFLFDDATKKLNKGSKTTYGSWCEKHGFKYASKTIPTEWLQ